MKIAIGADHRGFEAKRRLVPSLRQAGHHVEDHGCDSGASCDYIDFAIAVARAVADSQADIGILIDGSGIGMSIAANKVCGVRAALAHDEIAARLGREHNHCNVLCLGADLLGELQLRKVLQVFIATPFGEGRHARRVARLAALELEQRTRPKAEV